MTTDQTLTAAERTMLAYALNQAQEKIWSEDGFTDEDQAAVESLRRLTAVSSVGQAPATDQMALTERIAAKKAEPAFRELAASWEASAPRVALLARITEALDAAFASFDPDRTEDAQLSGHLADAVLAVLPTIDRVAVLREAADAYEEILENAPDHSKDPRYWTAIRDVTVGLRRMAGEADVPGQTTDETTGDCCGAEPPAAADWVGDCWCTLPPGHSGDHRCQPCADRHGAPDWSDAPAVDGAQQQETQPGI
jgi:hypothetical protein